MKKCLLMSSGETVEMIVVDGSAEAETLKAVTGNHVKAIISGKGRGKQDE
jgi:hypothetical protein